MSKKELIRIYNDEGKLIKKQCGKCGEIKDVKDFTKRKDSKDGLRGDCKECMRKCWNKNKEQYYKQKKIYYEENREKILESKKIYYSDNKDKILEQKKIYYKENKEHITEYRKQYQIDNKDKISEQRKQYRIDNKDKILEQEKQYRIDNKDKILEQRKQAYDDKVKTAITKIYESYTKNNYINNNVQYGVIYGVHNKITNHWYIGQTTISFDIRYNGNFFKNKLKEMNEDKRNLLLKDLEEYGEESFEIYETMDVAFSPMELDEKEVYYIDYYKSYEEGYNSNRGFINGRQTLYDTWIEENKKIN